MKTKANFIIVLLGVSCIFASEAKIIAKTANLAGENLNSSSINLTIRANEDVLGVQFDIIYNSEELNLSKGGIISKSGIEVFSNIKEAGLARVLMFSMTGEKILDVNSSEISDLLEIDFQPNDDFNGTTIVTLENVILAGEAGKDLSVSTSSAFEVSFTTPQKTSLSRNYPNPFNPSTAIDYQLSIAGMVSIIVYDLKGAVVKTLINEHQKSTYHNIVWNGFNDNGQSVASGRYLLKMTAPGYTETITMTLLK